MGIKRAIAIIGLARALDKAEKNGSTIITVPNWIMPEVRNMLWARRVERAAERWERNVGEVSVTEWQKAMSRIQDKGRRPTT